MYQSKKECGCIYTYKPEEGKPVLSRVIYCDKHGKRERSPLSVIKGGKKD